MAKVLIVNGKIAPGTKAYKAINESKLICAKCGEGFKPTLSCHDLPIYCPSCEAKIANSISQRRA